LNSGKFAAYNIHASAEFVGGYEIDLIAPEHLALCLDHKKFRQDIIWFTQDKFNDYTRVDGDTTRYGSAIYFASSIDKDPMGPKIYRKSCGDSFQHEHGGSYYVHHEDHGMCIDGSENRYKNMLFDKHIIAKTPGLVIEGSEYDFQTQKDLILLKSQKNMEDFLNYKSYGDEVMGKITHYNHMNNSQTKLQYKYGIKNYGLNMN
jgi:hypothetical protein